VDRHHGSTRYIMYLVKGDDRMKKLAVALFVLVTVLTVASVAAAYPNTGGPLPFGGLGG
jgi:hypothetical protein